MYNFVIQRKIPQITILDLNELRKKIRIGDVLEFEEILEEDPFGKKIPVRKRKQKAKVIAKYPHLVEIDGGKKCRTMTYTEILVYRARIARERYESC